MTLWKSTGDTSESGETSTGPEEGTPGGLWGEAQVDDGRNEAAAGITLLQDTTGKTTSLDGKILEGCGGSEAQVPPILASERLRRTRNRVRV